MASKKDIRGASLNGKRIALISLAAVALLLAAGLLALYFGGFRYMKVKYVSALSQEDEEISFIGFVNKDGSIKRGSLTSAAKSGKVAKNAEGLYVITYSGGDRYTGEMDGLQRQGYGVMEYASGDRYEGSFSADKFQGQGKYEYLSGDCYEGQFAAGKKNGQGVYTWYDDEGEVLATYTGAFSGDRRNGYGVFAGADGTTYAGNFVNDVRSDTSAEVLIPVENGVDRYFGGYKNDVRSGFGYYFYAGGNVYVGFFENNKPEGQGTIYFAAGSSYTGTFVNGNLQRDGSETLTEEEVSSFFESLNEETNPITGEPSVLGG